MAVVRFAPSPTGHIHIGNARTALTNWIYALKTGGEFVLRFDDTDVARSKHEYAEQIAKDLDWLGIKPHRVVYQSKNLDPYAKAVASLKQRGLLYPCYETPDELDRRRKRARAAGRPPIYDRAALKLTDDEKATFETEGRKPHWRFKLEGKKVVFEDLVRGSQTIDTASVSDPVLIRADGSYLYTLPSVVDDIDMGITHIIRGEDHVSNTGVQIEIFEVLGGKVPVFAHHNLLTDATGQGLSKRLGSLSIFDFKDKGLEPLAVSTHALLIGTSLPFKLYDNLQKLGDVFEFSMISRAPARFDEAELEHLNARYVQQLSADKVRERLKDIDVADFDGFWQAVRPNLSKVDDARQWARLIKGEVTPKGKVEDLDFITRAKTRLPQEPWDQSTWHDWTSILKQETDRKGKSLFLPLRLALTGRADGPELTVLLPLIGRKACLARLNALSDHLS